MKAVSWNIKGVGRREKQRAVKRLVRRGVSVESNGLSGGLMIYWKSCFFTVERIIKAESYILLVGFLNESKMKCGFGNIYAPNDDEERAKFWEELLNELSN
ncbi:hypothetical protein PTKIN_Ptkin16aG0011400 [Pterospermum kingtungense]